MVKYVTEYSIAQAIEKDDLDMFLMVSNTKSDIPLAYLIDATLKGAVKIVHSILQDFELVDSKGLITYLSVKLGVCKNILYPELLSQVLDYLGQVAYGGGRTLRVFHWNNAGALSYVLQYINCDEYLKLINKEIINSAKEMSTWSGVQLSNYIKDYNITLRRKVVKKPMIEFSLPPENQDDFLKDKLISEQLEVRQNATIASMGIVTESEQKVPSKYEKPVLTMEERLRVAGFNVREVVEWACKKEGYI